MLDELIHDEMNDDPFFKKFLMNERYDPYGLISTTSDKEAT
jgi:hypothetical protein